MSWQFAVAIAVIANVLTILVQRRYSQRSTAPATFPPFISYAFGVLPVGIIAGIFVFPHHIAWSWWLAFLLLLEGVAMALSGWSGFYVARKIAVVPLQTIYKFCTLVVILLGWILLDERLNALQLLGAFILLVAALLAIWAPIKNTEGSHRKLHLKYALIALFSAATLGIGLVTEKAILNHMQIGGVFLVGWVAQTVAMLVLAFKDTTRETLRKFSRYEMKWSVRMGLANGLTGVFYVYAIVHADNISLVTAILSIVAPLTVLGAFVLLREREHQPILWISLAISFIGLVVGSLH